MQKFKTVTNKNHRNEEEFKLKFIPGKRELIIKRLRFSCKHILYDIKNYRKAVLTDIVQMKSKKSQKKNESKKAVSQDFQNAEQIFEISGILLRTQNYNIEEHYRRITEFTSVQTNFHSAL